VKDCDDIVIGMCACSRLALVLATSLLSNRERAGVVLRDHASKKLQRCRQGRLGEDVVEQVR